MKVSWDKLGKWQKRLTIIVTIVVGLSVIYPIMNKVIKNTTIYIKSLSDVVQMRKDINYVLDYLNILNDVVSSNMVDIDSFNYVTYREINDIQEEVEVEVKISEVGNPFVFIPLKRKEVWGTSMDFNKNRRYYITYENKYFIYKK